MYLNPLTILSFLKPSSLFHKVILSQESKLYAREKFLQPRLNLNWERATNFQLIELVQVFPWSVGPFRHKIDLFLTKSFLILKHCLCETMYLNYKGFCLKVLNFNLVSREIRTFSLTFMKTKYRGMHKKTCLEPRFTQDIHLTKVILILKGLHATKVSHFLNFLEQACLFIFFFFLVIYLKLSLI